MKTSHVVYGIFVASRPRTILYVGSSTEEGLSRRIEQHRRGEVRTTRRMAEKHGVLLAQISAHALCLWTKTSREGRVTRLCRALGMARWNFPYTLSSEDNRRGARAANIKINSDPEHQRRAGRIGGKVRAKQMMNSGVHRDHDHQRAASLASTLSQRQKPNYHDVRRECGLIGDTHARGIRAAHFHWHIYRGLSNPECPLCMSGRTS